MDLKTKIGVAIAARGACLYEHADEATETAVETIRQHLADDIHAAGQVARFTDLRQAAGETPIEFVRRIVGAWLDEAAPRDEVA